MDHGRTGSRTRPSSSQSSYRRHLRKTSSASASASVSSSESPFRRPRSSLELLPFDEGSTHTLEEENLTKTAMGSGATHRKRRDGTSLAVVRPARRPRSSSSSSTGAPTSGRIFTMTEVDATPQHIASKPFDALRRERATEQMDASEIGGVLKEELSSQDRFRSFLQQAGLESLYDEQVRVMEEKPSEVDFEQVRHTDKVGRDFDRSRFESILDSQKKIRDDLTLYIDQLRSKLDSEGDSLVSFPDDFDSSYADIVSENPSNSFSWIQKMTDPVLMRLESGMEKIRDLDLLLAQKTREARAASRMSATISSSSKKKGRDGDGSSVQSPSLSRVAERSMDSAGSKSTISTPKSRRKVPGEIDFVQRNIGEFSTHGFLRKSEQLRADALEALDDDSLENEDPFQSALPSGRSESMDRIEARLQQFRLAHRSLPLIFGDEIEQSQSRQSTHDQSEDSVDMPAEEVTADVLRANVREYGEEPLASESNSDVDDYTKANDEDGYGHGKEEEEEEEEEEDDDDDGRDHDRSFARTKRMFGDPVLSSLREDKEQKSRLAEVDRRLGELYSVLNDPSKTSGVSRAQLDDLLQEARWELTIAGELAKSIPRSEDEVPPDESSDVDEDRENRDIIHEVKSD